MASRLRELRHASGLTLAEVARATRLSPSFVSMVETGKTDISLARLLSLVTAYGVTIHDLFIDSAPSARRREARVIRRKGYVSVPLADRGVRLLLLAPAAERRLEPVLIEIDPGAGLSAPLRHEGEEFVYVIEGEVVLTVGRRRHRLGPGETAYYPSTLPHRFANPGRRRAVLLGGATYSPRHVHGIGLGVGAPARPPRDGHRR
ncbi:MAG TPA: cupin domain-containing protein [Thermodesulfobacteriota bacterium]